MSISGAAGPLLVAAGIGAAFVACGDESTTPAGELRPTLTRPAGDGYSGILLDGQSHTTLDLEYQQQAADIIRSDSTLLELGGGTPPTVGSVGGWYAGNDFETGKTILIGAVARVHYASGVSQESIELPWAGYRPYYSAYPAELRAAYSRFREGTNIWQLAGVVKFEVAVDLQRSRVVRIEPPYDITIPFGQTPGPTAQEPYAVRILSEQLSDNVSNFSNPGGGGDTRSIVEENEALSAVLAWPGRTSIDYSSWNIGEHRMGYARAYWGEDEVPRVTGDFPLIVDQDTETGDYRSEIVHFENKFARYIDVTVDLDIQQVISVEPDEGD